AVEARRGEERMGGPLLLTAPEQRRRHPQRFIPRDEPAALAGIALPPRIAGSRVRPRVEVQDRLQQMREAIVEHANQWIPVWIGKDDFGPILFPPLHVPEVPRRDGPDVHSP